MLDERSRSANGPRARPISCEECTIQIGEGFQETKPFEFVDETSPGRRLMRVCWRCWESLNRRQAKRLADAQQHAGPLR